MKPLYQRQLKVQKIRTGSSRPVSGGTRPAKAYLRLVRGSSHGQVPCGFVTRLGSQNVRSQRFFWLCGWLRESKLSEAARQGGNQGFGMHTWNALSLFVSAFGDISNSRIWGPNQNLDHTPLVVYVKSLPPQASAARPEKKGM